MAGNHPFTRGTSGMITSCIRCGKPISISAEHAQRYPMGTDCGTCGDEFFPEDEGPFEPTCWGVNSYEHYRGDCQHFLDEAAAIAESAAIAAESD